MIFFIINHTSIKLGRKVYLNMKKNMDSGVFLFIPKTLLTGQQEVPNVNVVQLPLSL